MTGNLKSISFNRGVPAEESLPSAELAKAISCILDEDSSSVLQYGNSKGYPPLREILTDNYCEGSPTEVLVGNGSLQLLDILTNLHLKKGDAVIVEKPTYDRAITIFDRAGAQVVGVKLEKDGVSLQGFEKAIAEHHPKLFYTIPDFQNPTGTITSREKRREVAKMAKDHGVTVVEDSPYRRLRYRGEEKPTIRSFSPESVLQISSFSKLICPGIRVGWLAGKPGIVGKIADYAEDTYITPTLLTQGLVYQLIKDGWLKERVQELIDLYQPRLNATLESLENYFPESDWVQTEGGFFVGLWLPNPDRTQAFYSRAKEKGLVLSSPNGFFPDRRCEGFVRLPFPALSTSEIEEGIERLAEVWGEI